MLYKKHQWEGEEEEEEDYENWAKRVCLLGVRSTTAFNIIHRHTYIDGMVYILRCMLLENVRLC